jgi:formylmethanofuran dehydrogenase subunit B
MKSSTGKQSTEITCPACGLLCDDITPQDTRCAKAKVFFTQPAGSASALIRGKQVSLAAAVQAAARILSHAENPLFAGLSTDIDGFRALYPLAKRTKANLQHMNHKGMQRYISALQSVGWQTTTLTEVRNRADLILCIGTDIITHHPRFFERCVWTEDAMFTDPKAREIVYLGDDKLDTAAGRSPNGHAAIHMKCKPTLLPELLGVLHAILLGKPIAAVEVAGVPLVDLQALAEKLKAAKYAVLAWTAKDLDFPHAELAIERINALVATLNQNSRAMGLPLGASDGDTSANYAHTWLDGRVLNTASTTHDALLWVNSLNAERLPDPELTPRAMPLIVLGNANTQFSEPPEVFIPVATPGLDCGGTLFRVDGSVALPLKKVRDTDLLAMAEIVRKIEAELP